MRPSASDAEPATRIEPSACSTSPLARTWQTGATPSPSWVTTAPPLPKPGSSRPAGSNRASGDGRAAEAVRRAAADDDRAVRLHRDRCRVRGRGQTSQADLGRGHAAAAERGSRSPGAAASAGTQATARRIAAAAVRWRRRLRVTNRRYRGTPTDHTSLFGQPFRPRAARARCGAGRRTGSGSSTTSSSASRNVSTTVGSKCVPRPRRSTSTASSKLNAWR